MQIRIMSLSEKAFYRLENFCNRENINMRYAYNTDDPELYDIHISGFQEKFFLSSIKGAETIAFTSFNQRNTFEMDASDFHRLEII